MSEIINLNKKRKANMRAKDAQRAVENRAKFGRTKDEKRLEKMKAEQLVRHIDAHKRETDEE